MTLAENVALPLRKHQGLSHAKAIDEARVRLGQGLHGRAQAQIATPGRASATACASAPRSRATLALHPDVVLFDEPTTGLDPVSARRIDQLIRELAATGVTPVVVSHDPPSIFGVADRVALLYQGVVHVLATPAELDVSQDPIVQQFIRGRSAGPMETPGF